MSRWWPVCKWMVVAVLVTAMVGLNRPGLPALAQDTASARLCVLEISLWPEFDKPELLVIFQGRLADDVPLPAVLTLTIPGDAGEPHAVAAVDEAGQRLNAAHDVQALGEEIKVTYTSLEYRTFQFEYYLDGLQVDGKRRQFTFRYRADVPLDDLTLEFQQPSGAANVVLDPPAVETSLGFGGLTYHRLPLGPLDAGQMVAWQVSYEKSDPRLSADATGSSGPGFGLVALIGIALAVALGGLWVVGSPRRRGKKPPKHKRRKDRKGTQPGLARPAQPTPPTKTALPSGFCHQCGASLKADAVFCHRCGTRRKGA